MNLSTNTAAPPRTNPGLAMLRAIVCFACASSAHAFVAAPPPTRPALTASARRAASPRALLEVAPPSFNLALGSIALGGVFGVPGSPLKNKVTAFVPGALLALFGLFIAFQTATLRFTFDDKQFSLVKADLSSTGENVVVGGENRWRTISSSTTTSSLRRASPSSSVRSLPPRLRRPHSAYGSLHSTVALPYARPARILRAVRCVRGVPFADFKETQTPEDQWDVGPGEQANSAEALAKGAKRGQVPLRPSAPEQELGRSLTFPTVTLHGTWRRCTSFLRSRTWPTSRTASSSTAAPSCRELF